jgi:DNA-binding NarL/FixJ family response regulator
MSTDREIPVELTDQERVVLQVFVGGKPRKEIANQLGLTISEVNRHVRRVLTKIRTAYETSGMTSAKVMMLFAFTNGLVPPLELKSKTAK